ncbi:MAG: hypothetical protein DRH57_08285 [Candidatus Cloacimonadota bacterium]|nr:MAG: hypothetical protein DRH57_08285 [Candidatus Cloacimonadota bacterium]
MIMKSQQDLDDLKIGARLYVSFAPKLEVYDSIFTFNTSANVNAYHPVFIFEKKHLERYEPVLDTIRRSYTIKIQHIIDDVVEYDSYNTHAYYVSTSERETLQLLNKGQYALMATLQRSTEMVNRLVSDFNASDMMIENKEKYPEDWV